MFTGEEPRTIANQDQLWIQLCNTWVSAVGFARGLFQKSTLEVAELICSFPKAVCQSVIAPAAVHYSISCWFRAIGSLAVLVP